LTFYENDNTIEEKRGGSMMSAEFTNLNVRVDKELKTRADALLDSMGLNLSTAINIFIRQVVKTESIPFMLTANPAEDMDRYDLPLIRRKLAEAEAQAADPGTKRLSREEIFAKRREKYGYEI
jgi:DNA-damage-inducible protein J